MFAFANDYSTEGLVRRFSVSLPDWQPRYRIGADNQAPVIIEDQRSRRLGLMRWGWRRESSREPILYLPAEKVATKARRALLTHRCLVTATAYYDRVRVDKGMVPWAIRPCERFPFGMAALWELVQAGDVLTPRFVVLTVKGNRKLAGVLERMPAVLPLDIADQWLCPTTSEKQLLRLLAPYDFDALQAYPVGPDIWLGGQDTPEMLDPLPNGTLGPDSPRTIV